MRPGCGWRTSLLQPLRLCWRVSQSLPFGLQKVRGHPACSQRWSGGWESASQSHLCPIPTERRACQQLVQMCPIRLQHVPVPLHPKRNDLGRCLEPPALWLAPRCLCSESSLTINVLGMLVWFQLHIHGDVPHWLCPQGRFQLIYDHMSPNVLLLQCQQSLPLWRHLLNAYFRKAVDVKCL